MNWFDEKLLNYAIAQTVYVLTVSVSQILLYHNEAVQEVDVDLWFQIIYLYLFFQ